MDGWQSLGKKLQIYGCIILAIRNEHFKLMFLAPNPVTYTYRRVSTHHVIPVSGGGGGMVFASSKKLSPDGEIYGFGMR